MKFFNKLANNIKKWLYPNEAHLDTPFYVSDKSIPLNKPSVALTYAAVFACVRVIAETIATLPLFVYQIKGNNKIKAKEHNLYTLLHDTPNEESTSVSFMESLIIQILVQGNGFIEIVRDNFNNIKGLYLLDSNKIRVFRDTDRNIKYEYTNSNGTIITLSKRQVLHIPGLGWDGIIGYSPITLTRKQISTAIYQDNFTLDFFSNGVKKVPILTHPSHLSKEAKEYMKESFRESFNNGIVVLEEGMKVETMTMNLSDAQFLESRRFSIEEICRIFRVPPHLIADLSRSTNNNIEHQSIEFVTHTIRPWCVRLEKALNTSLLNKFERQNYNIEFMIDGLLRGDSLQRQQSYQIKLNNGVMTRNEWRSLENMNEVEDEYGNDYFVSQQIRPLNTIYKEKE